MTYLHGRNPVDSEEESSGFRPETFIPRKESSGFESRSIHLRLGIQWIRSWNPVDSSLHLNASAVERVDLDLEMNASAVRSSEFDNGVSYLQNRDDGFGSGIAGFWF